MFCIRQSEGHTARIAERVAAPASLRELLRKNRAALVGWRPQATATFAGRDTDMSRDYEYTDWDAVERFGARFAPFADRRA